MSNHTKGNNVILTWFLKGNGVLRHEDQEYRLYDNCVCLRGGEIPYTMELIDDAGPRLFIIMQPELFHFLCMLVPELAQMPPVWECPFSQEVFDAFLICMII